MKTLVSAIMQGYGSLVTLTDGEGSRMYRAFIGPVTGKGWEATRKLFGSLGEVRKGQYIYIGPADVPLSEGQSLLVRQEAYQVRRCETVFLRDEAVYVWAALVKTEGDGAWNS